MTSDPQPQGHDSCGAKTRGGTPCQRRAGAGTDHVGIGCCKLHGGCTPSHQAFASRELARRACVQLGVSLDVHPAEALVREVCETAGNVEFYRSLVQELPTHPDPDVYIEPHVDDDGELVEGRWERGDAGVYGRTYHVSGIPTGEAKPHILVTLYNEERKHLLAATTAALKAGVEARRVRLAEQEASLVAEGFRAFAIALGHDPAEPKVREAFRTQLTLIAGGRQAA